MIAFFPMARIVKGGLIQCANPVNDESRPVREIQAAALEKHLPFVDRAGQEKRADPVSPGDLQRALLLPVAGRAVVRRGGARAGTDRRGSRSPMRGSTRWSIVVPVYEREQAGVYYNTAAVLDADGKYLGKYRKNHIPHTSGFWEKYFFKPGNLGYPVFQTAYATVGVYICYDRHFPEGARLLGLNGAEIVFNPSATVAGLSQYLWKLEQPAHAVANGYFMGCLNRVGTEAPWRIGKFYGHSYFVDPRGKFLAREARTGTSSSSRRWIST